MSYGKHFKHLTTTGKPVVECTALHSPMPGILLHRGESISVAKPITGGYDDDKVRIDKDGNILLDEEYFNYQPVGFEVEEEKD